MCFSVQAQQRGALHGHILAWFKRKKKPEGWQAVPPVPRTTPGTKPMQRSFSQVVPELSEKQEDSCYQLAEMGRVSAEMVRPTITPGDFGGFDFETFRFAAFVRTKQIRSCYLHVCTPKYCLKDRSNELLSFESICAAHVAHLLCMMRVCVCGVRGGGGSMSCFGRRIAARTERHAGSSSRGLTNLINATA